MKFVFSGILTLAFLIAASASSSAAVYTYNFTSGESAVPTAPELTFGAFQRENVNAASQTGIFRSSGWNSSSTVDTTEYVQFTISVNSGYQLVLKNLALDVSSSASGFFGLVGGPDNLRVSVLSGVLSPGAGNANTPLVSQNWSGLQGTSQSLNWNLADQATTTGFTVRLYGWNAEPLYGTMSFDNVALDTTVTPVPEPVTAAAAIFGMAFAGMQSWRNLRIRPIKG